MREDNIALMKRGYAAFSSGDLDTVRAMSADDCVWHTPQNSTAFEADYRGPDGVVRYLTQLFEMTDGTFKDEPEAFFGDDDTVTVMEHVTGTRRGRTLDAHVMHVYRVRDGKVRECTEYVADPAELQAFWS